MRRALKVSLALILILALPASAATSLTGYSLIAGGKRVALSSSTGYIGKSGSRLTVPLKTVCDALSISCSASDGGKRLYVEGPNKARVAFASGYAYARVNNKKKSLLVKAYVRDGLLMADLSALRLIGAAYKTASAAALAPRGYPDGAVSVSLSGESVTFPALSEQSFASQLPASKLCDQMVVVKYSSGSKATLTLHEKDGDGLWRQTLLSDAYVGRNGIGKTREGDKKTPIGTFNLKQPFGIKDNPGTSLDYVKVTRYHYWCGASGSKYYNQLIDTRVTSRARTPSDEYLIQYTGVYDYCAFIDYNASGTAGKGSCIFLHCTGSKKYTAGCVAVPRSVMIRILKSLKPGCKIVIY